MLVEALGKGGSIVSSSGQLYLRQEEKYYQHTFFKGIFYKSNEGKDD